MGLRSGHLQIPERGGRSSQQTLACLGNSGLSCDETGITILPSPGEFSPPILLLHEKLGSAQLAEGG